MSKAEKPVSLKNPKKKKIPSINPLNRTPPKPRVAALEFRVLSYTYGDGHQPAKVIRKRTIKKE